MNVKIVELTYTTKQLKPYNNAQVVMIRGLFANWKQPIFYDFDCKMTKLILHKIINSIEPLGFHVVGMVCDLGGSNVGLFKELGISHTNTWFNNPYLPEKKIYVFADVPHLIKLIRNNFLDHGFILDGKEIIKSTIEKLIDEPSSSDLSVSFKINKTFLTVKGIQRQKVKLATKLFSHTISKTISRCAEQGGLKNENALECADFFKLVNEQNKLCICVEIL